MLCPNPPLTEGLKFLTSRTGRETIKAFRDLDLPFHQRVAFGIGALARVAVIYGRVIH